RRLLFCSAPPMPTSRRWAMDTPQLSEVPLKNHLFCNLNPSRFPRMTSVMGAIVGHLLDAPLGDPRIVEITVTSDGFCGRRIPPGSAMFASSSSPFYPP